MRRKEKPYENDRDKWAFPNGTTTLQVALPNEWISEIDDALDDLYPALRDRADFACKACEYALESWQEGKATPEGKALIALARKAKRRLATKKKRAPKKMQVG